MAKQQRVIQANDGSSTASAAPPDGVSEKIQQLISQGKLPTGTTFASAVRPSTVLVR
jgi:hypothetical protein